MKKSLYSSEYQALVSWLKQQRESQGLTMRQLAELIDKPHSFVGKVEQSERRLDVVEFIHYCKALNCSPHDAISLISPDS